MRVNIEGRRCFSRVLHQATESTDEKRKREDTMYKLNDSNGATTRKVLVRYRFIPFPLHGFSL